MKKGLFISCLLQLAGFVFAFGDCRPVRCTATFHDFMGHERSYTRFWLYDDAGRLVLDSINEPDVVWASPLYTEHYSYSGDSVIGRGKYTGAMAMQLNSNKLPVVCILPDSARYRALYLADGRLEKVIIARTGMNEKGRRDVSYSAIDSIAYFEGNIISYQYTGVVNQKVYCTYLKDTLYKQDYNGSDRILSLIGRPDEVPGFLNAQLFSKELLSSEECGYTKTYTYELDEQGKVISMNKTYKTGTPGTKPALTHYEFKYDCK